MNNTSERLRVTTRDGKYTVIQKLEGGMRFLRHGSPWRAADEDFQHVGLLLALAQEIEAERQRQQRDPPKTIQACVRRDDVVTSETLYLRCDQPDEADCYMYATPRKRDNMLGPVVAVYLPKKLFSLWTPARELVPEPDQWYLVKADRSPPTLIPGFRLHEFGDAPAMKVVMPCQK